MYKDVFREVGLLEVFVTCLHRYASLLKEPENGQGKNRKKIIYLQFCNNLDGGKMTADLN